MELCSDGHGEVCFEARNCPACEALAELSHEKDVEIDNRDRRIAGMEAEIENLEEKL